MIGSLTLAVAAAATMFNLNCTGTLTTMTEFRETEEPYNDTYVIDLTSKKWCYYDCGQKKDIVLITDKGFILENEKIDTPHQYKSDFNSIDRVDGGHMAIFNDRSGGLLMKWKGHCTKQPFTGFSSKSPPKVTKF
jgi:hypothetical protein